jgi:hypothetical protein
MALASLMALHSAITAHLIAERLGIDRGALSDTWERVGDEAKAWGADDTLLPDFRAGAWQGRADPAAFYRACFEYVVAHGPTIRAEVDAFRREQLIRQLHAAQRLSPEREREIRDQPSDPTPTQPPPVADVWLRTRLMTAAEHWWTIPEHEGWLLHYHEQAFAKPAPG